MQNFAPKKSLGQHFLHDKNIAKKIVNLCEIDNESLIIEIGPGTGALTNFLVQTNTQIIAYEIDNRSVDYLQEHFNELIPNKLEIIQQDFLKANLQEISQKFNKKIKVIGNIPYYITSPILFQLSKYESFLECSVLMMQKEIYQRLTAKPKTKDYGILTLLANLFFTIEEHFDVPPTCFLPPPKVMSTVVKLRFGLNWNSMDTNKKFDIIEFVKTLFNQRRKIIQNSIQNYLKTKSIELKELENEPIFLKYAKMRPEELSITDYLILYDTINTKR